MFMFSIPLGIWEIALGGSESMGGIVHLVVSLIIFYYLTSPHMKTFFGRSPAPMGSPWISFLFLFVGRSPSSSCKTV